MLLLVFLVLREEEPTVQARELLETYGLSFGCVLTGLVQMCRGGRMFAPTKIWRRWHFRINVNQKRFAVCSALAASAVPALVTARGHRIENVSEIPFVVDNKAFEGIDKSKLAEKLLKSLNAWDDIERVKATKRIRPGKGKWRNRRYQQRRGPLIVYHEKGNITRAFR